VRRLEFELNNAAMFGLALHLLLFRQLRCLDRHRLEGTNELSGERRIEVNPAEHHTPGHAEHRIAAVASIDGAAVTSTVENAEPPSAPAAYQKSTE
jgi:hypothetical protein